VQRLRLLDPREERLHRRMVAIGGISETKLH
jgi:hypothetical protein